MPLLATVGNASASAYGEKSFVLPPFPTYLWVAGGSSGAMYTSTSSTASSWTSVTSSFGTTNVGAVASNGTRLFVAVGDAGTLATSYDGTTWTQQTSSFGTTDVRSVAYGKDGYWVAVGYSGKIATSTDGFTWTQRTSGTTEQLSSVMYGNNLWVASGTNGVLLTATDPTGTWTSRTSTITSTNNSSVYYWPTGAIWVLGADGGTTGALASSTDGTTWTARASAVSIVSGGFPPVFTSNSSVVASRVVKVVFPLDQGVQSSTNGTTWTARTPADATIYIQAGAVDDANLMVLIGGSAAETSTDGTTWTTRTAPAATINGICHSKGVPSIR